MGVKALTTSFHRNADEAISKVKP